jgi:hypothetical protein
MDTTRIGYIANMMLKLKKPVMLVGNAGSAKTVLLAGLLRELDEDAWMYYNINFNSMTEAVDTQFMLESPLEKKTGSIFGPPGTKRLIYFVDDLNMPTPDKYGTQSAIALMRQQVDYGALSLTLAPTSTLNPSPDPDLNPNPSPSPTPNPSPRSNPNPKPQPYPYPYPSLYQVDYGGFYDLKKLTMKKLENVFYVGAMNPTAGSFFIIDRMQRHFATFACPFPQAEVLTTIYLSVLAGHLANFVPELSRMAAPIINATIALHAEVPHPFRPTPSAHLTPPLLYRTLRHPSPHHLPSPWTRFRCLTPSCRPPSSSTTSGTCASSRR